MEDSRDLADILDVFKIRIGGRQVIKTKLDVAPSIPGLIEHLRNGQRAQIADDDAMKRPLVDDDDALIGDGIERTPPQETLKKGSTQDVKAGHKEWKPHEQFNYGPGFGERRGFEEIDIDESCSHTSKEQAAGPGQGQCDPGNAPKVELVARPAVPKQALIGRKLFPQRSGNGAARMAPVGFGFADRFDLAAQELLTRPADLARPLIHSSAMRAGNIFCTGIRRRLSGRGGTRLLRRLE